MTLVDYKACSQLPNGRNLSAALQSSQPCIYTSFYTSLGHAKHLVINGTADGMDLKLYIYIRIYMNYATY